MSSATIAELEIPSLFGNETLFVKWWQSVENGGNHHATRASRGCDDQLVIERQEGDIICRLFFNSTTTIDLTPFRYMDRSQELFQLLGKIKQAIVVSNNVLWTTGNLNAVLVVLAGLGQTELSYERNAV